MRLLVPDGTRRRGLPCEEEATVPPASPAPTPAAGSGRTVVVGIGRDAASRELLTWALTKVANAGDRVVALHVAALHVVAAADGATSRCLTRLMCRIRFYFSPLLRFQLRSEINPLFSSSFRIADGSG
jgi:hypothetical protein